MEHDAKFQPRAFFSAGAELEPEPEPEPEASGSGLTSLLVRRGTWGTRHSSRCFVYFTTFVISRLTSTITSTGGRAAQAPGSAHAPEEARRAAGLPSQGAAWPGDSYPLSIAFRDI
jgi:hypothetical protein